jgi:hypothetical protein
MDRRKPLLVNEGEAEARQILEDVTARNDARVWQKVRVADVLEIGSSGLRDEEYRYAMQAHFDFVVTSGERDIALFAVEFDEAHHDYDPDTIVRDAMKDSICKRFNFPLLRIDADFLRRGSGHGGLLDWLTELWFVYDLLRSHFPGEDFWATTISGENDRLISPAADAKTRIFDQLSALYGPARLNAGGTMTQTLVMPGLRYHDDPDGTGRAKAYATLWLPDRTAIAGAATSRAIDFPPITSGAVAGELAVIDAASKLDRFVAGDRAQAWWPAAVEHLQELIKDWPIGVIFWPGMTV